MRVKSLALVGATAAALGLGFAGPASAHDWHGGWDGHHGGWEGHHEGGCERTCRAIVTRDGERFGWVRVFVGHDHIEGHLHLWRTAHPGDYGIHGHCHHEFDHDFEHEGYEHHEYEPQMHNYPSAAPQTGFGGGSSEQLNLPLTAGALALVTGGLGLGLVARRRITSGARA